MNTEDFAQLLIHAVAKPTVDQTEAKEETIEIHGALQRLSVVYEKVRTMMDYQEERFIRRLAMRRILFRRLVIQGEKAPQGLSIVKELIRSGYLENGKTTLTVADEITELLKKYLEALPTLEKRNLPPELIRMQRRLIGIAAAEIEDKFHSPASEIIILTKLSQQIAEYLNTDPDIETYTLAMCSYLNADAELVAWRLFMPPKGLPENANWQKFLAEPTTHAHEPLREIVKLEYRLHDRQLEAKVRRFRPLVPPFIITHDLLRDHSSRLHSLVLEPARLEKTIENAVQERLSKTEAKVRRSLTQATFYIFITKMIFGLAIEIPYDLTALGRIAYIPLITDVIVPPLLMLFAGLSIRLPSPKNTNILVQRTTALLTNRSLGELKALKDRPFRQPILSLIFSLFYFATYVISFGGLYFLLKTFDFDAVSISILVFFISVVGFFAFRIRHSAKELAVIAEKEGFMLLIFDFFALPFLRVGRWLSSSIRSINVVLFVLDFLIEAPFKIFLTAIEDWFAFLREKREELN